MQKAKNPNKNLVGLSLKKIVETVRFIKSLNVILLH